MLKDDIHFQGKHMKLLQLICSVALLASSFIARLAAPVPLGCVIVAVMVRILIVFV